LTSPNRTFELDDRDLIASAQQGDRQAFTQLVRRHQGSVVSLTYRMCGDLRLAEDVAQEAFVRVWQNLNSYKPQYAFRSWLHRIAANAALDSLRRERPTADVDSLSLADSGPSPEQSAENDERATHVSRAIAKLSESLRVVLILREYQELTYQEIADALDIPIGTVMSRLNSARAQLRHELRGLLE
jgi:RNA polymerase sigma-70 factor (ECF subfamily)